MASVLLFPDNEGEDKHVESKLIPRLDESSNLSISTTKKARNFICEPFLLLYDYKPIRLLFSG